MGEEKTLRGSLRIEVVQNTAGQVLAGAYETTPGQTAVNIGSDPGWSHIQILNRLVSRRHLTISYEGESWVLVDSGSLNGTFIDGVELVKGRRYPLLATEVLVSLGSRADEQATRLRLSDQRGRNLRQDLVHDSGKMAFFLYGRPVKTTAPQYRLLLYMYERLGELCRHEKVGELCVRNWEQGRGEDQEQLDGEARRADLNRYAAVYEVINKVRKALADSVPADSSGAAELRRLIKDHRDGLIVTHSELGYMLRVRLDR